VVARPGGKVRVNAVSIAKPIETPGSGSVQVRRGETGRVADVIASVVWSGPATQTGD
jgi:hypothetical protein